MKNINRKLMISSLIVLACQLSYAGTGAVNYKEEQNKAYGEESVIFGDLNTTGDEEHENDEKIGKQAVAIGRNNTAYGLQSIAMGVANLAEGDRAIAFGSEAKAIGHYSVALGGHVEVGGKSSGGISAGSSGLISKIDGNNCWAIGNGNTIAKGSNNNFILGNNAKIGTGITGSIALGNEVEVTESNTVSIGNKDQYRTISYVFKGQEDHDAINFIQYKTADGIDATAWKTALGIPDGGTTVEMSEYYTKTEVNNTFIKTAEANFATKAQAEAWKNASGMDAAQISAWKEALGITGDAVTEDDLGSYYKKSETYTSDQIDGKLDGKADKSDVEAKLAKKADTTYVTGELAKKADQSHVDAELAKKADKTYVDNNFMKKTDQKEINKSLDKINEINKEQDILIAKNAEEIERVDDKVNKVGALSAALAGLHPMEYNPMQPNQVMAAVGAYRDSQAVAVGATHYFNEDLMMTAGISLESGSHETEVMGNLGVTWRLGGNEALKVSKNSSGGRLAKINVMQNEIEKALYENQAVKEENKNLKKEMSSMKARMDRMEKLLNGLSK